MKTTALIAGLMTLALAGTTWAADTPVKSAGGVLTGANDMTLYTFDKDMAGSGKSMCNGPCASNWPPLLADEHATATGDYSLVTRDDGAKQRNNFV